MIEQYGILSLVLLYLGVNLYYRNLKSILLFLVSLVVLYPIFPNKMYPILIAYTISIFYNIVKNFHLLREFHYKSKETPELPQKEPDEEPVPIIPSSYKELKAMNTLEERNKKNETEESEPQKPEPNKSDLIYADDDMVSDALADRFVDMLERRSNIKVKKNVRLQVHKIKPTLSSLDADTAETLRSEAEFNNPRLLEREITISRDHYIINGHYTWYVKKMFLAEKNETTMMDVKYTDTMPVRIIDLDIQPLMKKLESYKIEFNENALAKFTLDRNKLVDLRKNINTLKKTVKNLESHYNELTQIELV